MVLDVFSKKRKGCGAHRQGCEEHLAPRSVLRVFLKSGARVAGPTEEELALAVRRHACRKPDWQLFASR